MADAQNGNRTVLVAGGGIAGLSAAVEAAEAGLQVILVEREPYSWRPGRAHEQVFP